MESWLPSSARSVGGRASKRQRVRGNELPLDITHIEVLTRTSKLNMNDEELFDYFFARLQGNEMSMTCTSMECECLSIWMKRSQKLLHRILSGLRKNSKYEQD